jgi:NH3-dependent NAD+ synthetase
MSLSRELPKYTEKITEEIAAQCKALCDEVSASTRTASAETGTSGQKDARECLALCADASKQAADMAEFKPPQIESAQELSRQIEETCIALVEETRANCTSISEGITKMVLRL